MHIYLLIYEIIVAGNQLTVDWVADNALIFQQDSASAHRAQDTVALLAHKTPRFIGPDLWPPNSPDLNPADYKIWGYFQEQLYRSPIVHVTDLKQRLVEVWSTMKQRVIHEAVDEWQKRLCCCVSTKGGHFEHKL